MTIEKLAALGALGASGGIVAAWLVLVFLLRPVSTGGIDAISHHALALSMAVPMLLLAGAHAWFGLQLRRGAESIRG